MRIGVVGVGRMGRLHARFRSGLSATDRIALANVNDQCAVKPAGGLRAESAPFPEMVEDVDGAVITAPTSAHCLFRDFSAHNFDAVRFVTGHEVVNIYIDVSVIRFHVLEKHNDIDTGTALLRHEAGLGIPSATRHPLGYGIRMELHGSGDSIAIGGDSQIPLHSPLGLHAARAGRPRHRNHPRCARANQIHRVAPSRKGCRSGQQPLLASSPREGALVEFAMSESKGSDAMDASDTSGVARHRTLEGGKQC